MGSNILLPTSQRKWYEDPKLWIGCMLLPLSIMIYIKGFTFISFRFNRRPGTKTFECMWLLGDTLWYVAFDLLICCNVQYNGMLLTMLAICLISTTAHFSNVRTLRNEGLLDDAESYTKEYDLKVGSVYIHPGFFLTRVVVRFIGQSVFMYLYLSTIVKDYEQRQAPEMNVFHMFALPTQFLMYSQMGANHLSVWSDWIALSRAVAFHGAGGSEQKRIEWRNSVYLRWAMAFVVNCLYYDLIIYTAPLRLAMVSDGLDFVTNAFALTFITNLDNVYGSIEIKLLRQTDYMLVAGSEAMQHAVFSQDSRPSRTSSRSDDEEGLSTIHSMFADIRHWF